MTQKLLFFKPRLAGRRKQPCTEMSTDWTQLVTNSEKSLLNSTYHKFYKNCAIVDELHRYIYCSEQKLDETTPKHSPIEISVDEIDKNYSAMPANNITQMNWLDAEHQFPKLHKINMSALNRKLPTRRNSW